MFLKKSISADLETKRSIFLETGMIISLGLAIMAINWKTYDKMVLLPFDRSESDFFEEMVQITQQKPPESPKVNIPPSVASISIVDDDDPVDDYFIDAEAAPSDTNMIFTPNVPKMQEEVLPPGEEEIFERVESYPEFPGGETAMYKFLASHLTYPEMAKQTGIHGKVYVGFVVEKDGSITDVRLLRGIGGGCDEEAMRVVSIMPKWTPGKQRGIPVRVRYNFSVKFTLAD